MKKPRHRYLDIFRTPLCKCKEGSAAIEFALVAPIFFLLLMGILEMGLILFAYTIVDAASASGSRAGLTGYAGASGNRMAYIRGQIHHLSGGYLNSSLLDIQVLSYRSFANVGKPEPCLTTQCRRGTAGVDYIDINENGKWDADRGRGGAGKGSDIVLYKLTYPWKVFTPLMSNLIGNDSGNYIITAVATVKNEGFTP